MQQEILPPKLFLAKRSGKLQGIFFKTIRLLRCNTAFQKDILLCSSTLKSYMKDQYNIGRENDDLIIVSGAQQGIELSAKTLCNEGDTVIVEVPSFVGSLNSFKSFNTKLVGVPVEDGGISLEKLEAALKENPNTKLIYLIPNFQNPSGTCMSLEKRKGAYALAKNTAYLLLRITHTAICVLGEKIFPA